MPLLIASITRRFQGLETLAHFAILEGSIDGGYLCLGCGTHAWDRVTPVELADGGEVDQDATGDCSPLCRVCSFRRGARIVAGPGWSGMETADVSAIWSAVRSEQGRDLDRELAGYRAAALEDVQAANAALEQARSNHRVNDSRKVA